MDIRFLETLSRDSYETLVIEPTGDNIHFIAANEDTVITSVVLGATHQGIDIRTETPCRVVNSETNRNIYMLFAKEVE